MSNSCLKLYIGIPDPDDVKEYLYLDLVIPHREISLWRSKDELNDSGSEDFLKTLEEAINEATLYVRALNLRINIDAETIMEIAEDFSEREVKELNKILQEVRKE